MNKTVVIARIRKRSGFSIKNKGHFGLIMPIMKKSIVMIPMLKEAYIIIIGIYLNLRIWMKLNYRSSGYFTTADYSKGFIDLIPKIYRGFVRKDAAL